MHLVASAERDHSMKHVNDNYILNIFIIITAVAMVIVDIIIIIINVTTN